MLDWSTASEMPMHILLTKADKLAFGAAKTALLKVQQDIRKRWGDRVSIQLFSAPKRQGIEEAQAVLAEWLQLGEFALPEGEEAET
jgi:GTP-binding protein